MARAAPPWPLLLPLTLLLYVQLLVLGLMSLAWNLVALLLRPVLPAPLGQRIGRAGIAYGYRMFWAITRAVGMLRLEAEVLDALRHERRLIIVANHPSMLDALMLVARLPSSACIMKASLLDNIFLGSGARLARYISNASALTMLRQSVADLRGGSQLVMFPEGTRTTRWPVNRFQPGVTQIARLAKAPIQTVFIRTESPYLGKGWPLWKLPPLPMLFTVQLGRRFEPQPDADALLAELEAYFTAGLIDPRSVAANAANTAPSPASPDQPA